ncbi:MAG: heme-binding beta-barrel domain-containing protein [Gammaproteobacteria bacterium]|nr:heme-binding beta-barrel domain-containing protein [Gammaproteobacteria bacterium]MDP6617413.1 heme-binding beta-barrel domain-containing protein [Gammaproteobacteria bacterium]MDP6694660.1 heme-binding beta-barrel domain-containing protein [Gammaproteobacteria bacterium]
MNENVEKLGPLAVLAGVWQGAEGDDAAPDDDRVSIEKNLYRETLSLEPIGEINNHEQSLYGLRYTTMAWRLGAEDAFHEEVGYWLWDAANRQVMKGFCVPRGNSVLAGGTADADAQSFKMVAKLGSETYGILSNQFLNEEFQIVRYELGIDVHDADTFSYASDTVIRIKGQDELFHHRDSNTLKRME